MQVGNHNRIEIAGIPGIDNLNRLIHPPMVARCVQVWIEMQMIGIAGDVGKANIPGTIHSM